MNNSQTSLPKDAQLLLEIKEELAGDAQLNWDKDLPTEEWEGVTFDEEKCVIKIQLAGKKLRGGIPSRIGELCHLQIVSLYSNQLTGTIPRTIGGLKNLTALYLGKNNLTGTIPPELGDLKSLKSLSLYSNQLTGTIPSELSRLSNLKELLLDHNKLSGGVPPALGNLPKLEAITLDQKPENIDYSDIPKSVLEIIARMTEHNNKNYSNKNVRYNQQVFDSNQHVFEEIFGSERYQQVYVRLYSEPPPDLQNQFPYLPGSHYEQSLLLKAIKQLENEDERKASLNVLQQCNDFMQICASLYSSFINNFSKNKD